MNTIRTLTLILALLLSMSAKANIFVEKEFAVNSIEHLDTDYYYDTSEHTNNLTVGYMSSNMFVSVSQLDSEFLDTTYQLSLGGYVEESAISTRVSAGIKLVSKDYYPSPVTVGEYQVIPFGKVTYTAFDNVQPSFSIDSNGIFSLSLAYVF